MRAMFMGRVNEAWTTATSNEKRAQFWPAFIELHKRWKDLGAVLLASIDDFLLVGPPILREFNFVEIYEVKDLYMIRQMLEIVRHTDKEEVNIYQFVRFEVVVGKELNEQIEGFWKEAKA